jgi:transcriptional regulator
MYIPPANRVEDVAKTRAFIHAHGFATLVTSKQGIPWASHLPVLLDERDDGDRLRSHMARVNEQWRHFNPNEEVLCVFHGPHAYISPSWYSSKVAVPTWNYAVVHAYGIAKVEDDGFLRRVVEDTTLKYESKQASPWKLDLPDGTISSLMKAIVGFSIQITRVETKFKLGQNRSKEDQQGTLTALKRSVDGDSRSLADFISNNS